MIDSTTITLITACLACVGSIAAAWKSFLNGRDMRVVKDIAGNAQNTSSSNNQILQGIKIEINNRMTELLETTRRLAIKESQHESFLSSGERIEALLISIAKTLEIQNKRSEE